MMHYIFAIDLNHYILCHTPSVTTTCSSFPFQCPLNHTQILEKMGICYFLRLCYTSLRQRGVAQSGSALALGIRRCG